MSKAEGEHCQQEWPGQCPLWKGIHIITASREVFSIRNLYCLMSHIMTAKKPSSAECSIRPNRLS